MIKPATSCSKIHYSTHWITFLGSRLFQKLKFFSGRVETIINHFTNKPLVFKCLPYKSFENNVGKGEIARKEQFLLFPHCFLPVWRTLSYFLYIWNCRLQALSVWKSLKFVVWKGSFYPLNYIFGLKAISEIEILFRKTRNYNSEVGLSLTPVFHWI